LSDVAKAAPPRSGKPTAAKSESKAKPSVKKELPSSAETVDGEISMAKLDTLKDKCVEGYTKGQAECVKTESELRVLMKKADGNEVLLEIIEVYNLADVLGHIEAVSSEGGPSVKAVRTAKALHSLPY
jgi:hypothetical protein